jgi:hypothetical protein
MTRVRPERHPRVPALGLTAVLLAAACSGVGAQRAVNPYESICPGEKAYIQAVDIGDDATITEAVARMERDFNLIPDRQPRLLLLQAVDSASKGDPTPIRQSYLANCVPITSPSTTTSEPSPSGT